MAWAKDGTFYWGYVSHRSFATTFQHCTNTLKHVGRAIKKKLINPDDVVELWKLLLYKDHQSSDVAQQIQAQLGDRTVDDLIRTHLEEIIKDAKAYLKRTQTMEYTAEVCVFYCLARSADWTNCQVGDRRSSDEVVPKCAADVEGPSQLEDDQSCQRRWNRAR